MKSTLTLGALLVANNLSEIGAAGGSAQAAARTNLGIGSTDSPTFSRVLLGDGSALLPAMSFSADTNTGFFRVGADIIGIAVNGTEVWRVTSGGSIQTQNGSRILQGDGSAAGPSHSYVNDSDSGMYRLGADNIGLSAGGNKILDLAFSGAAPRMGFFGAAHAPKPSITGSRGGNAALASLLTELATLGLLTDNTTA